MFERFNSDARDVVVGAQLEAQGLRHPYLGTEHLLLGVLRLPAGTAPAVLADAGVTLDAARAEVETIIGRGGDAPLSDADAEALRTIGIDVDEIRRRVEASFGPGALDTPVGRPRRRWGRRRRCESGWPGRPFTPRAKRVIEQALREAIGLGHRHIGVEHMLLALAASDGLPADIMRRLGADPAVIRTRVLAELGRAA